MAFTIPNLVGQQASNLQARTAGTNEEIKFHRHCQKTVLSAYGLEGQGATWDTLHPNSNDDLQYLNNIVGENRKWWNLFEHEENITQDLRSILELLNNLVGIYMRGKSFSIQFQDNNNNQIGNLTMNPQTDQSTNYQVNGFGRDLKLRIGNNYL